jgi:phytoene dehydrogenase-like protein
MTERDVIVIGAGHNGLVAAAYLAKAGLKPLVVERSPHVGGCALTSEIAPGFRCPTLSHWAAIDPDIVQRLELTRHGLQPIHPEAIGCAPASKGRAITLWADGNQAAQSIARCSARDAARYPEFVESVSAIAALLRRLIDSPAPVIDAPSAGDLFEALKTGRHFRALGRTNGYRLLRWLTMPIADFAAEWFEGDSLASVVAAGGVFGAFAGPRSAGTTAAFLMFAARGGHPMLGGWTARGGLGALAEALQTAARQAGAEIRTGAEVRQILVSDAGAEGVVLSTGEEIRARAVVSNADPRRTLLELVDSIHLPPDFLLAARNIRMRGALSKVNFAVSALPRFECLQELDEGRRRSALSGWMRLAPTIDAIERAFDAAKYGGFSEEPWVEVAIPSLADDGLAPSGQHVISTYVQFTPFALAGTSWEVQAGRLGDVVTRTIDRHAPGFARSVLGRQVLTPVDLERTYGLTGGHIFHGELALDQLLLARPLLGWARHRTPIRNLYLCGAGTHPGTGLDGRAGALAAREILKDVRAR